MVDTQSLGPNLDKVIEHAGWSGAVPADPAGVRLQATADSAGHAGQSVSGAPTYYWANAVSGYFNNPDDWRGGVVPSYGSNVTLGADGGEPYTVTIEQSSLVTLNSIQIAANVTLAMFGPKSYVNETFVHADNGGANAGLITIGDSANFEVAGTFDNSGTIKFTARGKYRGYLEISQFGTALTLGGGGKVLLADGGIATLTNSPQTLTNVDNTLSGSGSIGGAQLSIVNQADGVINATGTLLINTGSIAIANAGLIEATGRGMALISGPVTNTGEILAKAAVTVRGNVSGAGTEIISGAAILEIASSYGAGANQAVSFANGAVGVFEIDQAENFTGTLKGLATGDELDLGDISFSGATFSYSGNTRRGELTVTDGTTTAHIALTGDYAQANFALSDDGAGQTAVTYTGTGKPLSPDVHLLIAAMASMHAGSGGASQTPIQDLHAHAHAPALARPHTFLA